MINDRVSRLINKLIFLSSTRYRRIVSEAKNRIFTYVKTPLPEDSFQVGLIGSGHFFQYAYVPAINNAKSLMFPSGILSRTPQGALKAKRHLRHEARIFSSFDELVDYGTKAVVIVAPNHMHYDYISKSLTSGLDVFCEKPATNSLGEALELRDLAEKNKSVLMIGFNQRYTDKIEKTKQFLDEGNLGRVLNVSCYSNLNIEQHIKNSSWLGDQSKSGGGVLHNVGTHLVNILLYLFGEAISVSSQFQNTKLPVSYGEDTAFCNIRFKSEIMAHLSVSYVNSINSGHKHFVIEGEKGRLESRLTQRDLVFTPHIGRVQKIPCRMETIPDSIFNELQEFCHCVKNRKTPKTGIDDFICTQEVIEAAKQAAKQSSVVSIGDMQPVTTSRN